MKPTAATVFPAPVACSNQNRRLAPGSSGASAIASSSPGSSQSCGSSSGASRSSSSGAVAVPGLGGRVSVGAGAVASVATRLALRSLELGGQRGERAGQRVDLVVVQLGAVEELRALLGEKPLEPEQQRVVAAPFERRHLVIRLDLRQRSVDRAAPRGARGEVGDGLALEQDRLAGELAHPIEVGLAQLARRLGGNVSGVGHREGKFGPALVSCRTDCLRRAK
jgi:hypothetical protein